MDKIDKMKLKELLLREGYIESNGLDMTIEHLIHLEGKASEMLVNWIDNGILPKFKEIEGIDSKMLREQLEMKEPAIILSYGMLLVDPKYAANKIKSLLANQFDFHPKESDL